MNHSSGSRLPTSAIPPYSERPSACRRWRRCGCESTGDRISGRAPASPGASCLARSIRGRRERVVSDLVPSVHGSLTADRSQSSHDRPGPRGGRCARWRRARARGRRARWTGRRPGFRRSAPMCSVLISVRRVHRPFASLWGRGVVGGRRSRAREPSAPRTASGVRTSSLRGWAPRWAQALGALPPHLRLEGRSTHLSISLPEDWMTPLAHFAYRFVPR